MTARRHGRHFGWPFLPNVTLNQCHQNWTELVTLIIEYLTEEVSTYLRYSVLTSWQSWLIFGCLEFTAALDLDSQHVELERGALQIHYPKKCASLFQGLYRLHRLPILYGFRGVARWFSCVAQEGYWCSETRYTLCMPDTTKCKCYTLLTLK